MTSGRTVVVDYGVGNIGSIMNMLRKVGSPAICASSAGDLETAARIILPGVGSFDAAMAKLEERDLIPTLESKVLGDKVPLLGICLGMQILSHRSEEGLRPGLGWIESEVVRFSLDAPGLGLKVPHMGWNKVHPIPGHPLFVGLDDSARFYFVHSYHATCNSERALCKTTYGYEFPSGIHKNNIFGVQFHPEKSHRYGLALFRNFVALE